MLRQLGSDVGGLRSDELQIVSLVLNAMTETHRDLVRSIAAEYEAAVEAERAIPHVGGLRKLVELFHALDGELRRPRANPWPRTNTEVDEEPIHLVTPGDAAAMEEEDVADAENVEVEVTLIDSDRWKRVERKTEDL